MLNEKISYISLGPIKIDFEPPLLNLRKLFLKSSDFPIKIFGNNGSGKTSITFLLGGIIPNVKWANSDIDCEVETNKKLYKFPETRNVWSIIPQSWQNGLLGYRANEEIMLSCKENINWGQYIIKRLDLDSLSSIPPSLLSEGEKKRLLIGIAFASGKPLIISDEWSVHLDFYWRDEIKNIFFEYMEDFGGLHLDFTSTFNDSSYNKIEMDSSERLIYEEEFLLNNSIKESIVENINFYKKNIFIDTTINFLPHKKKKIKLMGLGGDIIEITGINGSGKTSLLKKIWGLSNSCVNKIISPQKIHKSFMVFVDPIYQILGPTVGDEFNRVLSDNNSNKHLLKIKDFIESILNINFKSDVLELSFGQRKTLAIIIGAITPTPILLIDEPFSGLDKKNRLIVEEIINIVANRGKLVLIANQERIFKNAKTILLEK